MVFHPKKRILILIVLLGAATLWLRCTGLYWGSGTMPHPDETRIVYAVDEVLRSHGNPKFFAYGHLPIYLQAAVFKARQFLHLLSPDYFTENVISGRMVAAVLSLGTVFLAGRILVLLGLPLWCAFLAAFGAAFSPLSVQLSQFSTVDAHTTFFVTLALERTISLRKRRRWLDFTGLSIALGGALACKANSIPLIGVVLFALFPLWKSPKFWILPLSALACFSIFEPYAWIDGRRFFLELAEQARWVRGEGPPVFFQQYEDTLRFLFSGKDLFFYSVGPLIFLLSWIGFFRSLKNRDSWVLAAWFVANWFLLGTSYAKFSRYWLPVVPVFAVYAAWGLHELRMWFSHRTWWVVAGIFLAHTFLAGALTHTLHLQPHPNVTARLYLDQVVPKNQEVRVLFDSLWVGFPPLGGDLGGRKVSGDFAGLFETDTNPEYLKQISEKFAGTDYFLTINHLSVRTAYEQIQTKYVQAQTFEALRDRSLGFKLIHVVSAHPWFWPNLVRDFSLDHSIPIYDHPTVFIWKNEDRKLPAEIEQAIMETDVRSPKDSLRYYRCLSEQRRTCILSPPPSPQLPAKAPPAGIVGKALLDSILGPRTWQPLAWYLFFLLTGLAAWPITHRLFPKSLAAGYGVSRAFGWIVFGYFLWILGHLPGGLLGSYPVRFFWLIFLALGFYNWKRWRFFTMDLWKRALGVECLFLYAYLAFFVFRLFAPDVYWSENPIDLGYLSALSKAVSLPPHDPGYAGTSLNYYYYGFYLFSLPAKVLSIPPTLAYGLAMAMIPSLISGLLITLGASLGREKPKPLLGLFSVLLVLLVGNWDGARQLGVYFSQPQSYPWSMDFFHSAHAVIKNTVHEFPLWSYLFVDLHAHLISSILFVSFLVWLLFSDLTNLSRLQIFFGAVVLGSMGPTSTWDYFTMSVLVVLITGWVAIRRRSVAWAKNVAWLLVLSYLLFSPFYLIFTKRMTGLGIGLVGELMTDVSSAICHMGLFLTFAIVVQPILWREIARERELKVAGVLFSVVIAVASILFGVYHRLPATFLLYAILGIGFGILAYRQSPQFPFVRSVLLAAFALCIVSMCEIFVIKDFLQGGEWKRMNTVFKFYYQAWLFLAVASPALLYEALKQLRSKFSRSFLIAASVFSVLLATIWTAGAIGARTVGHAFQYAGLPEATLDGLAWLKNLRPHEYRAVAWLWRYGSADDVLMEASKEDYRYEYNVVSGASGVPSVLTWWSHADQRDRPSEPRVRAVKEFYQTTDARVALRILRQFHVTYVYVGEREREEYGEEGLEKFKKRPDLFRPVYSHPLAALYQINR